MTSPGNKKGSPQRRRIEIDGIVQGVGFRPFVYNLACGIGLSGHVRNTSAGVVIEAEGDLASLDRFLDSIRRDAPPLARIATIAAFPESRRMAMPALRLLGASRRANSPWSRPMSPPVPIACASSTIRVTGVLAIRSRIAPIAARATRLFKTSLTTGQKRRWQRSQCVPRARPSIAIRRTAVSTRSRTPCPECGPSLALLNRDAEFEDITFERGPSSLALIRDCAACSRRGRSSQSGVWADSTWPAIRATTPRCGGCGNGSAAATNPLP